MDNYRAIDNVFEGMMLNTDCPPTVLHKMFSNYKNIRITIKGGIYLITYNNMLIAKINSSGSNKLMLLPGLFIHRKREVFKTYNKLLREMTDGYFLKFIAEKWTLCKNQNIIQN